MGHRTWLLEALRLHFDEKLPRIEAGRRLGIPRTTVCDLFVRFRQAGLPWPLPANITDKMLDKRLYQQSARRLVTPSDALASTGISPGCKRGRRPNFPREFRIALVKQSMQPGISVAQLAREHNINDNLLFNWRRRYRQELLSEETEVPDLLPVTLTPDTGGQTSPTGEMSCCELVFPAGTLRIRGELTPALLQVLIREMQGETR